MIILKKIGFAIPRNKLRKYWYRCLHERSRLTLPEARLRQSKWNRRANGEAHGRCFFTIEGTDHRQSRYRSSLLATCSYAPRHVILLSAFAYFIFKELQCEIPRYRVKYRSNSSGVRQKIQTLCIVCVGVWNFKVLFVFFKHFVQIWVYLKNDVNIWLIGACVF